MNEEDILNYWRDRPNVSPSLKIVSIALLLAILDEADSVTFNHKRGKVDKLLYAPKSNGECELVPPPRHLSPLIIKILRHIGRKAAKNPTSSFNFSYTETGHEREFILSIDYNRGDNPKIELDSLILDIYLKEENKRAIERIRNKKLKTNKQLIAIGVLLTLSVAAYCLFLFLSS